MLIYPSKFLCTVVIIFLFESKGSSPILLFSLYNFSLFIFSLNALFTIAASVGSPTAISMPSLSFTEQSVHIDPSSNKNFSFCDTNFTTVILFCVNVPVLSEHITLLLPNVSTAGNFLIIAFLLAIFVTPIDNIIVTIAGSPSGIAATANPTDVINICIGSIFFTIPITNIIPHIIKHTIPSVFPTSPNFFCIGVSGDTSSIIISAIFPILVHIPVSVTIAFPLPLTTVLAMNAIFFISPSEIFFSFIDSFILLTGSVSPVKLDSSIFKLNSSIILQSAGT